MTKSLYGIEEQHTVTMNGWGASSSFGRTVFSIYNESFAGLKRGDSEKDFDVSDKDLTGMDSPRSASRNGLGVRGVRVRSARSFSSFTSITYVIQNSHSYYLHISEHSSYHPLVIEALE